jgi:hypothetical protein
MRRFALVVLAIAAALPAAASDQYGGFQQYATSGAIKPFCRDLGGVLGSATFHSARSIGVSGWDVGARGGMQFRPDKNDAILRNNGVHAFGLPWVQGEVGLPWGIDGFVRGISYQGLTIAGGGVRYSLLKANDKPWTPKLLVSGVAHSAVHQQFSASHFGASLVASMGTPMFTPYIGVGIDRTRLVVRSSTIDPTQNGREVTTNESRFTAGVQYRPWTFFYVHGAFVALHGYPGAEAGLGIRF